MPLVTLDRPLSTRETVDDVRDWLAEILSGALTVSADNDRAEEVAFVESDTHEASSELGIIDAANGRIWLISIVPGELVASEGQADGPTS